MVSKQVDLVVEEVGSLADSDFKLQSLTPSVTSVMVIGPKSEVDKATHARARLLLKTIEPLKPKPIPTDIVVLDKSGSELRLVKSDPHTVYVTPIIVAAPVEKTVIVEANFVGSPAPGFRLNGYKLDKETISISGRSAVLAALSKISTQPIDVSGITSDRHFKAKLVFPSGTQATGVSSITGTYYIAPDPAFQGKTPVDNRNPPASTGGVP
jgi:YbbR domain-containing protein